MEKTLDEAINYTKEAVKTYRAEATYNFPELKEHYDNCVQCANQHDQLAEWLEELKSYKEAEEQGLIVRLPCKVGDKIWELCLCDDGNYRIFPMIVKSISKYGALRQSGKDTTIWHIYAESDYTYVYKNFIDLGKTWFLTSEEAEKKLEELKNEI